MQFKPTHVAVLVATLWMAAAAVGPWAAGAESAEVPARFETLEAFRAGSPAQLDHSLWQRFLETYTVKTSDGVLVNYGAVPNRSREQLRTYIDSVSRAPWSSLDRSEQLAAWINLYNAMSVEIVLEFWPLRDTSILRSPPQSDRGPYAEPRVEVRGVALSAEDIMQILRGSWGDPRILYALHGAAMGGPRLTQKAYTGIGIHAQLDRAAFRFVNERGATTSFFLGKVRLSRLYEWYADDFGGSDARVLNHVRRHADPRLAKKLAKRSEIDGYQYDWRLDGKDQRAGGDGLYGS